MKSLVIYLFIFLSLSNLTSYQDINEEIDETTEDNNSGECSADEIIDQFIDILTPDDYEEGKTNIKYEILNFEETLEALNRLQQYSRNVSAKMSDFSKSIYSRIYDVFMEVDLSPECMKSLARVGSAIRNGELWALKCNNFENFIFKVILLDNIFQS
jgi:hypothetical protein